MITRKPKGKARRETSKFLETLMGGPLTLGAALSRSPPRPTSPNMRRHDPSLSTPYISRSASVRRAAAIFRWSDGRSSRA